MPRSLPEHHLNDTMNLLAEMLAEPDRELHRERARAWLEFLEKAYGFAKPGTGLPIVRARLALQEKKDSP